MSAKKGRGALVLAGLAWGTALGVALGSLVIAPALEEVRGTAEGTEQAESANPRAEEAEAQAEEANALLAEESGTILADSLKGSAVIVLRAPGAAADDAARIRELLDAAGADNAGEVTLTEKFLAQGSADQLGSIIANTLPAGAQLSVDARSPSRHAGQSLAAALFSDGAGSARATPEDRGFVLSTLAEAGFLEYTGADLAAADAAVIVGGPDGEDSFADGALADFAAGLDAESAPVVLALPGAGNDGVAGALASRGETGVVVQDVAETEAGAIQTVRSVRRVIDEAGAQ